MLELPAYAGKRDYRGGRSSGMAFVKKQTYSPRGLDRDGQVVPRRTYLLYACTGALGRAYENGKTGWHVGIKASALEEIVLGLLFERYMAPNAILRAGQLGSTWEQPHLTDQRRLIRAVMLPVVHRVDERASGRRGLNRERVQPNWR